MGSAASRAILLQKNNTSHICNLTCPSRGWDMMVVKEHLLPLQKHPPRTGLTGVHNSVLKDFVPLWPLQTPACTQCIHTREGKKTLRHRKSTQLKPIVAAFSLTPDPECFSPQLIARH